jgi:hypothetical protein
LECPLYSLLNSDGRQGHEIDRWIEVSGYKSAYPYVCLFWDNLFYSINCLISTFITASQRCERHKSCLSPTAASDGVAHEHTRNVCWVTECTFFARHVCFYFSKSGWSRYELQSQILPSHCPVNELDKSIQLVVTAIIMIWNSLITSKRFIFLINCFYF